MKLSYSTLLLVCATPIAFASSASAQCVFDWAPAYSYPGWDGSVRAFAVFDDGHVSGPVLFAGGTFMHTGAPAGALARWNGARWNEVGSGIHWGGISPYPVAVNALVVWDDGSGPALYVGGSFDAFDNLQANNVVKWDGSSWTALGQGMTAGVSGLPPQVHALAVFDDGSGPALYAGGLFAAVEGTPANFVARWNGASWSPVGSGLDGAVYTLLVHDDGAGPHLYAGGAFTHAGGNIAAHIARWDGAAWSAVGSGTDATVRALVEYDDGAGAKLFAGGDFVVAGGFDANRIARWDGGTWSQLDGGVDQPVHSLAVHSLDGTPTLVAGGTFSEADGQPAAGIASWNGDVWTPLAAGATAATYALAVFDEDQGLGPALFAGGTFEGIDGVFSPRVARWKPGAGWTHLDRGQGFDGSVLAIAHADDGSGAALYAGGEFMRGGSAPVNRIAKWNGARWTALGSGVSGTPGSGTPSARALAEFDDGGGPALYVGGYFTHAGDVASKCIARWKNGVWSATGGVNGQNGLAEVNALVVYDDGAGPALYVGGGFSSAGGVSANGVARWNGTTWSAVGTGISSDISAPVTALAVFDDGSGPKLFAAGEFLLNSVSCVLARFDGTSWTSLASETNQGGAALAVFDDGSGPGLYLGGSFGAPGIPGELALARWTAAGWSAVQGAPGPGGVSALAILDDGSGPALCVGGSFATAGGAPAANLARFDGQTWSTFGSGASSSVLALHAAGSGTTATLYGGGGFIDAGGAPAWHIAAWREVCDWTTLCSGEGPSSPCPCANAGAAGHGCANSVVANGALLDASGSTDADTLVLTTSGTAASVLTVFFKGNTAIPPLSFGDGLRCAGGSLIRFGAQFASGGSVSYPQSGDPALSQVSGTPPGSGLVAVYQAFYRDAAVGFCTSETFNSTNALRVVW